VGTGVVDESLLDDLRGDVILGGNLELEVDGGELRHHGLLVERGLGLLEGADTGADPGNKHKLGPKQGRS
jgi:hypothetical protein